MKKTISIILTIAMILGCAFMFTSCGESTTSTSSKKSNSSYSKKSSDNSAAEYSTDEHHKIKFTIKANEQCKGGEFIIETYPEYAPETCKNFVKLVSEGFYDGLTFHRVVTDFMAQGGDPNGDVTGGSPNTIHGEFSSNGFTQNTLKHTRGIVSMARSNDNDSASSQFFICYKECDFLDGSYAAFGEVIEGMDVVEDFLNVDRTMGGDGAFSSPIHKIVIAKAEVIE